MTASKWDELVRTQQIPLVDLRAQYLNIKDEIHAAIAEVMADTAFVGGPYVSRFEEEFSAFTDARHVVGVGNGTDALTIALRALAFDPGFEAILPANSFIATAEAVTHAGGKPRFCDVDPDTYLINLDAAADLVTARTRVIIPVHLYGQMVDIYQVRALADRYSLAILEDGAQAHGARFRGVGIGAMSEVAAYSFYPSKNLGAYGDGGAITTDDSVLAGELRKWRDHGSNKQYEHEFEGYNSRLDGIQAAILSVKLRHLQTWILQRQGAATNYHRYLEHLGLPLPRATEKERHVYHMYVIQVEDRDAIRRRLTEAGISTGIHYPTALPFLQVYRYLGYQPEDFPVCYHHMQRLLSLPLYPELTEEQIAYVATSLEDALG